jgi:cysteinyl-tRNA synthetase
MTTSSAPHLRETSVAEVIKPKTGTEKAAEPKAPEPKKAVLGKAAESGDPTIQRLLAEQEIHRSNGDDEQVDKIREQLAGLGFE